MNVAQEIPTNMVMMLLVKNKDVQWRHSFLPCRSWQFNGKTVEVDHDDSGW